MDEQKLAAWIRELIRKKQLYKFYKSQEWVTLKESVLKDNHYECAECKKRGIITRYDTDKNGNRKPISTVHHVQYVRKHPELAMSRTYMYKGKEYINLMPVCKACHNRLHPEKQQQAECGKRKKDAYINRERW